MDETWLCHYDLETKQRRRSVSPRPKKNPSAKIRCKTSRFDLWDQDDILLIDYLPKGQTNAEYYLSMLVQLKDILWEKRRGNQTNGVLFLHENAPPHRSIATQKRLSYLGFQCFHHPPRSPDLAPSDYHLFRGLKVTWKVAIFRPTQRSLLPRRPG